MVVVSCAGHTLIPDWSNSASRLLFAISCSAMNTAKRRLATRTPRVGSKMCQYDSAKRVSAPAAKPNVLAGTPAKPERLVVSYEKIEGTSHIEHLCGSMVLRKLGAGSTDVYLYEEAKATQRSPEDTLNGMRGTLEALRIK